MSMTYVNPVRSGLALALQLRGDNTHPINCIYIEFENVAAPGDTVVIPSPTIYEGLEYYNNLGANRDFVRAPITSLPALSIASGYSPYFAVGEGNTLTVSAITAATAGELGRPFLSANNSKVYGLAIVAVPDWADRSRDIVIQRAYYSTVGEQVLKSGTNFSVSYPITFGG